MLLVSDMRARAARTVAACLGVCVALGCADDLEGPIAPMCTDDTGCPAGSRCVDGRTCERVPGAEPPPPPPVSDGELPQPPTGEPSGPEGQPPLAPLDAGELEPLDAGLVTCRIGEVVCAGECVDLSTDRRNCGACGVDCGIDSECLLGTCQPDIGPQLPPGDPPFGF